MSVLENFPFREVAERGSIRESDVAQLRRALDEDGLVSRQDAEQLIALDAACPIQGLAWCEVFQEAITDFIVRQAQPKGYVTLENAQWLIRQLAPHGTLTARKDLDLVVDIIDVARWSPEVLIDFALHQVKHAITKGTGVLYSRFIESGVSVKVESSVAKGIASNRNFENWIEKNKASNF